MSARRRESGVKWAALAFVSTLLLAPGFVRIGRAYDHERMGYLAAGAVVAATALWAKSEATEDEESE